jgi:hypothetical protein
LEGNRSVSTLDEKGEPSIHPTWYYFDNNKDKIYIESGKASSKTQNLRKNNIIYYCIDDDNRLSISSNTFNYQRARGNLRSKHKIAKVYTIVAIIILGGFSNLYCIDL